MTKARIAVLVPSTDTVLEQELPLLVGDGASVHFARMRLPGVDRSGLLAMEAHALEAVELLADIRPDIAVFGCTSGSFFRGAAHERHLASQLADRVAAPVLTTAWAVRLALAKRGRTVRVRTPYDDDLTAAECSYLRAAGLEVSSATGLGLTVDAEIASVTPARLLAHVTGDDRADALLVSCTNLPTLGLLDRLAMHCDMPAVSSNSSTAEAVTAVLAGTLRPLAVPGG